MTPIAFQLGTIVTLDGRRYQITPNDILWLARSVEYEGGNEAATMWVYAWRFMILGAWDTLAELVQAHSQPVNPIWRADGSKCRPGGQYHGTDSCSPTRLARREAAAVASWDSLESAPLVLAWAQGKVANPAPRAIDFADPSVSQSFMDRNPGTQVVLRDGGWYLTRGAALTKPADYVQIEYAPAGRILTAGVAFAVGAGLAAGVGAWVASR